MIVPFITRVFHSLSDFGIWPALIRIDFFALSPEKSLIKSHYRAAALAGVTDPAKKLRELA